MNHYQKFIDQNFFEKWFFIKFLSKSVMIHETVIFELRSMLWQGNLKISKKTSHLLLPLFVFCSLSVSLFILDSILVYSLCYQCNKMTNLSITWHSNVHSKEESFCKINSYKYLCISGFYIQVFSFFSFHSFVSFFHWFPIDWNQIVR